MLLADCGEHVPKGPPWDEQLGSLGWPSVNATGGPAPSEPYVLLYLSKVATYKEKSNEAAIHSVAPRTSPIDPTPASVPAARAIAVDAGKAHHDGHEKNWPSQDCDQPFCRCRETKPLLRSATRCRRWTRFGLPRSTSVPCLSPQRFRHSDSYLYSGAAFS